MKIHFLLIFFSMAALSMPQLVTAQSPGSLNINVNARLIESIELTTIRNMRFGEVQSGQLMVDIDPVTDPEAGKMIASGIPGAQIRISFIREWQLTSDRGNQTLSFFYRLAGNNIDDQSTSELLQTDNRNLQFNENGEYFFWIGGSVDITDALPGSFEGEFTIQIEYI